MAGLALSNQGATIAVPATPCNIGSLASGSEATCCETANVGLYPTLLHDLAKRWMLLASMAKVRTCAPALRAARHSAEHSDRASEALPVYTYWYPTFGAHSGTTFLDCSQISMPSEHVMRP